MAARELGPVDFNVSGSLLHVSQRIDHVIDQEGNETSPATVYPPTSNASTISQPALGQLSSGFVMPSRKLLGQAAELKNYSPDLPFYQLRQRLNYSFDTPTESTQLSDGTTQDVNNSHKVDATVAATWLNDSPRVDMHLNVLMNTSIDVFTTVAAPSVELPQPEIPETPKIPEIQAPEYTPVGGFWVGARLISGNSDLTPWEPVSPPILNLHIWEPLDTNADPQGTVASTLLIDLGVGNSHIRNKPQIIDLGDFGDPTVWDSVTAGYAWDGAYAHGFVRTKNGAMASCYQTNYDPYKSGIGWEVTGWVAEKSNVKNVSSTVPFHCLDYSLPQTTSYTKGHDVEFGGAKILAGEYAIRISCYGVYFYPPSPLETNGLMEVQVRMGSLTFNFKVEIVGNMYFAFVASQIPFGTDTLGALGGNGSPITDSPEWMVGTIYINPTLGTARYVKADTNLLPGMAYTSTYSYSTVHG